MDVIGSITPSVALIISLFSACGSAIGTYVAIRTRLALVEQSAANAHVRINEHVQYFHNGGVNSGGHHNGRKT